MTSGETNNKKRRQVGESHLEWRKGKSVLISFKIRQQDGKVIEPWKGKEAAVLEWMRNNSAMLGYDREETASFWKIEKDAPIYFDESIVADTRMDLAYFASDKDGTIYNVASRLIPKGLKPGDKVRLTIMGCCSIVNVTREDEELS